MTARVRTVAFQGVDVLGLDVQVQMAGGLPAFANAKPIPEKDLPILPDFAARTPKASPAPPIRRPPRD